MMPTGPRQPIDPERMHEGRPLDRRCERESWEHAWHRGRLRWVLGASAWAYGLAVAFSDPAFGTGQAAFHDPELHVPMSDEGSAGCWAGR